MTLSVDSGTGYAFHASACDGVALVARAERGPSWPAAVSDGLTIPCADCGLVPMFDYRVTDEFWRLHVSDTPARLGAVCLPCLDRRCAGHGLAEALRQVQWTGTGHTVLLTPTRAFSYAPEDTSNVA